MSTTPTQNQPDARAMQAAKEHEQYIRGLKDGPSDGQHGAAIIQRVYGAGQTRDWQTIAVRLWMLLDDIDTQDDASKSDNAHFRKRVYAIQQKRNTILDGESIIKEIQQIGPTPCENLHL